MLSKKIKYILISVAVVTIFILAILLIAYYLTMSTYKTVDSYGPYDSGEYACGDHWHGQPNRCSFKESYKESLTNVGIIISALIPPLFIIRTFPLTTLIILIILIFLYKYKVKKKPKDDSIK